MGMRLIDADALCEVIEDHVTTVSVCPSVDWAMGKSQFKKMCLEDIKNASTVTVDAEPVRHGRWDLCITAKGMDLWTADAVCRNCGFTKPQIWSGFFPLVPPDIARDTTRRHSERVKLPNYCESCGAKMDGDKNAVD